MARISLAVSLMLLVALSVVYETEGMFSLPLYLKNFPKLAKDFEPFANKAISDFLGDLEGKCPKTTEFTDFFVKVKDYMTCFRSKDIQAELAIKSETLFRAMSLLDGTKGVTSVSFDYTLTFIWHVIMFVAVLSEKEYCVIGDRRIRGSFWMACCHWGKGLVEMKKSGLKEITFEQRKELIVSMVKWTRGIGLFVKTASENKGQSIDLSPFGIDYDTHVPSPSKRAMYEKQETFSLPLYLTNFPRMGKDFETFAYKGMSDFMGSLESKCPATPEFKDFFATVEDFMACFKSASPEFIQVEMSAKSEKLYRAMSLLDGSEAGTTVDSLRMVDGLLSMGNALGEMKKSGSKEITFEQRKESFGSMVKWARSIGLFVKKASEKKGKPIDLAPFGIDYEGTGGGNGKGPGGSEL